MNPFILAGLVFTGIGLVQEAIFADEESKKKAPKPKAITAPTAAPVHQQAAPVVVPAVKPEPKPKKKAAPIEPPTDG